MQAKDAVRELLDDLPDQCTIEDVLYRVYLLCKIEEGDRAIREGRVKPHEQVFEELRRKWHAADE